MSWFSTIPVVGKVFEGLFGLIDQAVTDKDKANQLKADLEVVLQNSDITKFQKQLESQTKIITSEAAGNFFQRTWRPGLMVLFGIIIANNYILNPWLDAMFGLNIIMEIPPDMWDLLKLGIGGYVMGRSVEKGVQVWKEKSNG